MGNTNKISGIHNAPKAVRNMLKPVIDIQYQSASPSELPSRWSDKVTCRPLEEKEIEEMIDAFAKTAKLCKEAGVDGVEVHAVHEGYLLDQFTLKYTNKRKDKWGGTFENRYRFATEIVKKIKETCGENYPVSLRYSAKSYVKDFCKGAMPGEEFKEKGRDIEEGKKAAKYLQDAGYDMLNTDNGTYDSWYWAHPPMYMPENCNLNDVTEIKKSVDIPVVCAGRMDPITASNAIKEGKIDAMGVARQFLADSEWVTKILEDRIEDIRPCICCHNACFNMSHYKGVANEQSLYDASHIARCALDPQVMQSDKYKITPAIKTKNIAIIGGGIGGMEAAILCAKRGHNVTIYEKTKKLGGVFLAAAAPKFKKHDKMLISWYKREINKQTKIDVKFETEINDITKLNADEIIIATGAEPRKLPIEGFENTIEAVDYLLGNKEVGNKVAIIGGGLTGCEIAYDLSLKGKEPIIIEAKQELIVAKGVSLANSSYLRDYFEMKKTPIFLESQVEKIKDNKITIIDKNKNKKEIKVDSIITSIGYIPNPIAKNGKNVHIIGDANEVGNLRTVIWNAWDVCMKI